MAKQRTPKRIKTAKTTQSAKRTSKPKEAWYWVCALYRAERRKDGERVKQRTLLWERNVFLIKAPRGQERRLALKTARAAQVKYKNALGETVDWRFDSIESYAELFDGRITSGTQVYWSFFRKKASGG
jgi:hypothetical protein